MNTFQGQLWEGSNLIVFAYETLPLNPSLSALTPVGVNFGDGVKHTSFEYDKDTNGGLGPVGSLEGHTLYLIYNKATDEYEFGDGDQNVPEPATVVMLLGGSAMLMRLRRRRGAA